MIEKRKTQEIIEKIEKEIEKLRRIYLNVSFLKLYLMYETLIKFFNKHDCR
jgi:hypothetical protein